MKGRILKAAFAAVLTLLIISGCTPIKPIANFFERIGITVNAQAEGYVHLDELTDDYVAQNGDMLTGELKGNYKISIADGAGVALWNVNINTDEWAGITCLGDAFIIVPRGENTIISNSSYPGILIPENKNLSINGYGSLDVRSDNASGIGGAYEKNCGNIEIIDGTITATGGANSAGIGSSCSGSCGNIEIRGGTVTATGGVNAAGIGCGYGGSCGDITISIPTAFDGKTEVTAISGSETEAYSIGLAGGNSECGKVTIDGVEGMIMESPFHCLLKKYAVTLKGGANAGKEGDNVAKGFNYIANEGYYFEKFEDISLNGITVHRKDKYTVTVRGFPTCDTEITVPDAVRYYTITLTGGTKAVRTGTDIYEEDIFYTANDGYHFEEFEDIVLNGVTVHRESEYKVTVSGRPTHNTEIKIPDAIYITKYDFEKESPKGWTTEPTDQDDSWVWGTGDSSEATGAHTGQHNMKYPNAGRSNNKEYYLIMPAIDFSDFQAAALEFSYINASDSFGYNDRFGVYYRIGTGNWNELYYTKSSHKKWTCEKIYLPAEAMPENVQIGFMAKTHYGCGVGLDDVALTMIPLLGDADLDGEVTDKDAALVLKYISTGNPFFADDGNKNENALAAANADCTGDIDMLDVIWILNHKTA
ncbi:MAG: choice-of-anchor J domain-containing protein [Firmicutes bacterium]|nr:choice-of-anchor J domain-containing protein [Bacillota bacterium]